jgi:hypothetical protein
MHVSPRRLFLLCAALAVLVGGVAAVSRTWMCDDAFISFRHADNLVRGNGLVFNVGERVEGETNLLWTLWIALGLKLGVAAERWSAFWGIACFGATLALLARRSWRIGVEAGLAWPIPVAAVLGAAHVEWTIFATSGLETSAFTLLSFGGYLLLGADRRRLAAAGALFALASLTRPDGVIFVAVCGLWLLAGRDWRGALAFAAGFLALWAPATAWRVSYYGAFFPNTYYAKSAAIAWWSQGFFYARLYFTRYWPLLVALPLSVFGRDRRAAALELALVVAYAAYVMRVGGDFMFARLLLPITPFVLLLLERGLCRALGTRPGAYAVAVVALAAGIAFTPNVVDGRLPGQRGIVDERAAYASLPPDWAERTDRAGETLAGLFEGLPISICFYGMEARIIYRSRVRTAIECATGLTDATIAHQPLLTRGRVGHEKAAPLAYLLQRHVNFVLSVRWANEALELDRYLPDVPISLRGVRGRVISWDPEVMPVLAARGARFADVPSLIDQYIANLPKVSDGQVRTDWEGLRRLYFDHAHDATREAPFRARLGLR